VAASCFYDAQVVVKLSNHELSVFALLQGVLSWLAVLCIVVRLTITHSTAVLVAYYDAQPNSLARRTHPLLCGSPGFMRGCGCI
jgi:hypothetical protein